MIALCFNVRRNGTIIQPKRSGKLSRYMKKKKKKNEVTEMIFLHVLLRKL